MASIHSIRRRAQQLTWARLLAESSKALESDLRAAMEQIAATLARMNEELNHYFAQWLLRKQAIEAAQDGQLSPPITGDGSGAALPPIASPEPA